MTAIPKVYLYLAGAILAVLGFALYTAHERQVGALQVLLHVADSSHFADSTAAVHLAAVAKAASDSASALRQKAYVEVQKDRAIGVTTDSVVKATANERARAERVLADSLATLTQMREELQRVVVQGRADSAQHATQRATDQQTIRVLLLAVASDTVALQRAGESYNALLKRTVAAEQQRDIAKRQAGSLMSRTMVGVAGFGLGVLAGRAFK